MSRRLRLRFWLLAMDLCDWVGLVARDAYLYALSKASDAEDWGPPLDESAERGEEG